jgi:aspartyl-tRNA(Asn)/glutamyl-tRNA(Gln) amidotransferase subunit B
MEPDFYIFIGLEIHIQLKTKTKMFCSCPVDEHQAPNTLVCPVCLGYPGTLPVLNRKAVELAIAAGKIFHSNIQIVSQFDRKNYFYPDLPKGYQITQFFHPICQGGYFEYFNPKGSLKKIEIERIHLEEDAGKIITDEESGQWKIDYNRAGIPLLEIVTRPQFDNEKDVVQFLKFLQLTLQQTGISDANLEKGNMRCDVNVSLSRNQKIPPYKTELKNVNSFKFIRDAIRYEINKQKTKLLTQTWLDSMTGKWNSKKKIVEYTRTKEDISDYRYLPDPDLPNLILDDELQKNVMVDEQTLPVLKIRELIQHFAISYEDALLLVEEPEYETIFRKIIPLFPKPVKVASWLNVEMRNLCKLHQMTPDTISPNQYAKILTLLEDRKINRDAARKIAELLLLTDQSPEDILQKENLLLVSEPSLIEAVVDEMIEDNRELWEKLKKGETKLIQYFIGQGMKKLKGKGNPHLLRDIIIKKLN